ncbi:helix-turn-helix transcriptional regulator [Flavobacterium algicola]|uniref:helix-turn-helix transcriptional regulator n=1 Tax=Flavobacterium algicola TaxID=556529 RepID=UPI001EFC7E4C|nr:hypothetical protein [Flavobacterium algicola]MCG9794032.1 hypothetical protein [Flavobacterium algicola]
MLLRFNYIFLVFFLVFAKGNSQNRFYRFVDSADAYIDDQPLKTEEFLNLIPEPVTVNIKGKLAEYYHLRALIDEKKNERAKLFNDFHITLRYAKVEKKYDIAGTACLELFFNIYRVGKDSLAYKYLDDAKRYYVLSDNQKGLAEVKQMFAYVALDKKNYKKSNKLILRDLDYFKNIKDDAYYYMYALFMLSNNYSCLNDLQNTHKYFNLLKGLRNEETITPTFFDKHIVTVNLCIAKTHLLNKQMDSCWVYLKKAQNMRVNMNANDRKDFYSLHIDYYTHLEDSKNQKAFIDSLGGLQKTELAKILETSIGGDEALIKTADSLNDAEIKNDIKGVWIGFLILGIISLGFFFVYFYRKRKIKVNEFEYLKINHEKLKVKVKGFESYISNLKKEVKTISLTYDASSQKTEIKKLYNNIHLNSKSILDKSESHLELISELNIEFFNTISTQYPELNASEIIICYYVFMGFKNKEIAVFINSTVRAVESKRYRINNKLVLPPNITLLDFLNGLIKNHQEVV